MNGAPASSTRDGKQKTRRSYSFIAHGYLGSKISAEEHSRKNCKLGTLYIAVTRYLIARTKSNENDNRWGRRKETAQQDLHKRGVPVAVPLRPRAQKRVGL